MKKLFFFGLAVGLLGAVSAILVAEAFTFSNDWAFFAVGAVVSIIVSVLLANSLYGKFMEYTKESQNAIKQAKHALKQR
jgi:hypothetical protein